MHLRGVRAQCIVPKLNTILGFQRFKSQDRHVEGEVVPRFGDGDDKRIDLADPLLEQTPSFRSFDVDQQREASE